MNKIIAFALTLTLGMTVLSGEAFAKRFGGGKSFGKQREQVTQPASPATPGAAAPSPAPVGGKSWLGPLAGLAAGGLLAALFFGGAFEGIKAMDIIMILLLAGAVFFILRALRRPRPQPVQYAGMDARGYAPQPVSTGVGARSSRPAWFEDEPFLRGAKGHFIRLQDAYDRGDLNDIREYTTPEIFAEISLQIQERGAARNKTDVVQLDANIVDVTTEGDLVVASVRFSGLIREEEGGAAQPFSEIWHIQKSATDRNAPWFVAGIQQVN
jgi:predicted lipid-binding transport protein (Tim44 family)